MLSQFKVFSTLRLFGHSSFKHLGAELRWSGALRCLDLATAKMGRSTRLRLGATNLWGEGCRDRCSSTKSWPCSRERPQGGVFVLDSNFAATRPCHMSHQA